MPILRHTAVAFRTAVCPHTNPAEGCSRRPYSIALVGLGYRGYRSHFLSLIGQPSISIAAVCDINSSSLASFSAKHQHIPAYRSLPKLLSRHTPDFAIVSVPHGAHMQCITTLAERGIAALKEKPVAESIEDYQHMMLLPVKIGVTFQKRFEPRFLRFRRLLPLVGDVAAIEASLALNITNLEETWRATSGVGVTEDLGCHMLDLIVWLFGLPTSLMAINVDSVRPFQMYRGDDVSDIMMDWRPKKNCIGHVRLSRVAHRASQSISVTGTRGTLILEEDRIKHYDSRGHQKLAVEHQHVDRPVIQSMVHQFGDWVAGNRLDFPTAVGNVRDTVLLGESIKRSLVTRQVQHPHLHLSSKSPLLPGDKQVSWKPAGHFQSVARFSTSTRNRQRNTVFSLNTGASIPALGLGTRRAEYPGQVYDAVLVALQTGYRHIDTAQSSGNEEEIGRAIRDLGIPREKVWITTKLDNSWHTRVRQALEQSLSALNTDYVDLYLMHWPVPIDPNDTTRVLGGWSFVDTWRQMQRLPRSEARNIGVSNFGITHLTRLLAFAGIDQSCTAVVPAVNQIELHPYWTSQHLLKYCSDRGIHCSAYSPLGSANSPLLRDPTVCDMARQRGRTPQQILLQWGIQRGTSVIPKSTRASRIKENFHIQECSLGPEEMKRLGSCSARFKSCKDEWLPDRVFLGGSD
ncbi:hypothetical protein ASPVEDRAFT_35858 [Aspergillus versicolor CBS 583.65]|uniref:D-xylose reductase [NAD(P)H] n=1 Tax=Aspergillus versicolor CBS 583.65 TaxID=1036611 RepID=A0A1L9P4L4_ASPVE|nr:uncharacterized protein ASPVEDRAFT_35858 [Aspergillus versicolor CBS 583.65]OJI96461.1 hypothetical protein ASPVEDRAFT_35858 [Aspergillus versicolor CBS 583.65]